MTPLTNAKLAPTDHTEQGHNGHLQSHGQNGMDVRMIATAAAFLLHVSRAAETLVDHEPQH